MAPKLFFVLLIILCVGVASANSSVSMTLTGYVDGPTATATPTVTQTTTHYYESSGGRHYTSYTFTPEEETTVPTTVPAATPTRIYTNVTTTEPTPAPPVQTTVPTSRPTPTPTTPGFGAIVALVGLIGTAFLVTRKP